ncbi:MAG: hypothetical protein KR126chlam4_00882 [Candidatus Anoxychlamydiales bacterium]|nr:hypothetical protein [Candidatus Anoxychlamydiales bacterium]NGX41047.1 hypothetical protein [Candidatus Anoxychlamydiales bacterium]
MSVARCERLFILMREDIEILRHSNRNVLRRSSGLENQPTQEQINVSTLRMISLRERIQEIITTMKKLNRLANNDVGYHHPKCDKHLRSRLTRSQDSMIVDEETILALQKKLNELFTPSAKL